MSDNETKAALRRHYPNISHDDWLELNRLRYIHLSVEEAIWLAECDAMAQL